MSARAFLILHGYQGSGPDHWQSWLAGRLRAAGEHVRYPDLPEPGAPVPAAWERALETELADLGEDAERVVVCHSLACILWLRHATARITPPVDRVLLVSPPCQDPGGLADWFPAPIDAEAVAAAATATRLVCSDDDPFCPAGATAAYATPLRLPVDLVAGGGHLNADAGFGPWPAVEAWAYGAKNGVEM